jgi:RNA polymerase sigma factor (sigma-70 family)
MAQPPTLEALFTNYRPRLLAMIQRRSDRTLSARRDPEDILSTAYFKAQAKWADFPRTGMKPFAWLYRIVLDCLLDDHEFHTRKRRNADAEVRWPDGSSMQLVMGLISPLTSPSEAVARKEVKEQIRRQVDQTLAQLRPADQEVLSMHFRDQLSIAEAARRLGLTVDTARQRYARARVRFRAAWNNLYGSEEVPRE